MDRHMQIRMTYHSFHFRRQCKHMCLCVYNTQCLCVGPHTHTCIVTGVWHIAVRQTSKRQNLIAFSMLLYNDSQKCLVIKGYTQMLFLLLKQLFIWKRKTNPATFLWFYCRIHAQLLFLWCPQCRVAMDLAPFCS